MLEKIAPPDAGAWLGAREPACGFRQARAEPAQGSRAEDVK
jgi:hypothetical protein